MCNFKNSQIKYFAFFRLYSTDDSSKESVVTLEDIQGVQDGDDDTIDKTTIQIGEKEKEIAHSKLTALISLLEKDRDANNSSRRYVACLIDFFKAENL